MEDDNYNCIEHTGRDSKRTCFVWVKVVFEAFLKKVEEVAFSSLNRELEINGGEGNKFHNLERRLKKKCLVALKEARQWTNFVQADDLVL